MHDIASLGDSCFVLASHALLEIGEAIGGELGRKPTLEELCEVLAWGFQGSGDDLLSDVHPGRIERVVCILRAAKVQQLSPGDVVAIPIRDSKYFLGVFLTKNRFGHGFGFFDGYWPCRPLGQDVIVKPFGLPLYTTLHSVWDGTWRLVSHRPDLLAHFPLDPEIYHFKRDHPRDDRIGSFGAAETVSGVLRSIESDEAARVGLLDGSYRTTVSASKVAELLESRGCGARDRKGDSHQI